MLAAEQRFHETEQRRQMSACQRGERVDVFDKIDDVVDIESLSYCTARRLLTRSADSERDVDDNDDAVGELCALDAVGRMAAVNQDSVATSLANARACGVELALRGSDDRSALRRRLDGADARRARGTPQRAPPCAWCWLT